MPRWLESSVSLRDESHSNKSIFKLLQYHGFIVSFWKRWKHPGQRVETLLSPAMRGWLLQAQLDPAAIVNASRQSAVKWDFTYFTTKYCVPQKTHAKCHLCCIFYSFWWLFLVLGSLDCQVSMECPAVTGSKSHSVRMHQASCTTSWTFAK